MAYVNERGENVRFKDFFLKKLSYIYVGLIL